MKTEPDPFMLAKADRRDEFFTGAITFAVSMLFLGIGLLLVQTTVFSTTNGLWKLIDAREWAEGAGRLVPANFTFSAVAAAIYVVSEFFGILPTRGLALWNSINIAFASGLLSVLFLRITQRKLVSTLLGLFFALSGGGLTHSLGSEDIAGAIPAIVIIFILISKGPISSFTRKRLFALSMALAYVHLWEWRAALPIYLALFVLLLREKPWGDVKKHLRVWIRIVLVWVLALATTYILVSFVFGLPGFDLGVFERYPFLQIIGDSLFLGNYPLFLYLLGFASILWSGKGVGTVWGGFTEDKISFQVIGLIETLFGGRNIGSLWPDYSPWLLLLAGLIYIVAFYGAVIGLRRGKWRQLGLMLVAYFLGSALFNLYSQPQDPQMQVTALPSTLLLIAFSLARIPSSEIREFTKKARHHHLFGVFLFLSLIMSVWSFQGNFRSFIETSSSDAAAASLAEETLRRAQEGGHVLFGNGWEAEVTWLAFEANGFNYLAKTPYEAKLTNVFLAVDFVSEDLEGSPSSWLCASWSTLSSLKPDLALLNVSGERQDLLLGLRTIIPEDDVIAYQEIWRKAFSVGPQGIVTPNYEFLSDSCEAEK